VDLGITGPAIGRALTGKVKIALMNSDSPDRRQLVPLREFLDKPVGSQVVFEDTVSRDSAAHVEVLSIVRYILGVTGGDVVVRNQPGPLLEVAGDAEDLNGRAIDILLRLTKKGKKRHTPISTPCSYYHYHFPPFKALVKGSSTSTSTSIEFI